MVQNKQRLMSIDIVRGFTVILMLFVNDLYMKGVPAWLGHTQAATDGMGLADWVFPSFLFMVGMSIPFAIASRINKGECILDMFRHIIWRTFSLILIGVALLNGGRLNTELVGITPQVWKLLFYAGIFLLWNDYPKEHEHGTVFSIMKAAGAVLIVYLLSIFISNDPEHPWLVHSWWGILGLIGWGYLPAALTALATKGKTLWATVGWLFFLALNILFCINKSGGAQLAINGKTSQFFSILITGNTPMLVMAGMATGAYIRNSKHKGATQSLILLFLGAVTLLAGFFLRKWFIISKIYATPSWGLICIGISLMLLSAVHYIADVKGHTKGFWLLRKAGCNPMTTYIFPSLVYALIQYFSLHILIYKQVGNPAIPICGSLAWAVVMTLICIGLEKLHIKLKL